MPQKFEKETNCDTTKIEKFERPTTKTTPTTPTMKTNNLWVSSTGSTETTVRHNDHGAFPTPSASGFFHRHCLDSCCVLFQRKTPVYHKTLTNEDYMKFNLVDRVAAGMIAQNQHGQFVLVQSHRDKWGFPKGGVDKDESLLECAIREMKEETGFLIRENEIDKDEEIIVEHPSKTNKRTIHLFKCLRRLIFRDESSISFSSIHSDITGIGFLHLHCAMKLNDRRIARLNFHTYNFFYFQHQHLYTPPRYFHVKMTKNNFRTETSVVMNPRESATSPPSSSSHREKNKHFSSSNILHQNKNSNQPNRIVSPPLSGQNRRESPRYFSHSRFSHHHFCRPISSKKREDKTCSLVAHQTLKRPLEKIDNSCSFETPQQL